MALKEPLLLTRGLRATPVTRYQDECFLCQETVIPGQRRCYQELLTLCLYGIPYRSYAVKFLSLCARQGQAGSHEADEVGARKVKFWNFSPIFIM